jgi:SAM-dependent methyltransferase
MAYALRLSENEQARYRMMARRALDREGDLWRLAGITTGARVVDVGCGPGAMLALLADEVGPSGGVAGVDADPDAVRAARAALRETALPDADVRLARADDTGLVPGTFDVAMLRHVLAHNGPEEQRRIVKHLATVVRPGGSVYLLDVDASSGSVTPSLPEVDDLQARYEQWHARRGNDLRTGRRLALLARDAGLEVIEFRGWFEIFTVPVGMRGPAWAAVDALLADGLAADGDLDRWDAAFTDLDTRPDRPQGMIATFAAVCRRADQR